MIESIDHLELWVGNARQAAHYYCSAFGFSYLAYAGPETGSKDRVSYVIRQGRCVLMLTASLVPDDPIARRVHRRGDGIQNVAFMVKDAAKAFRDAVAQGAVAVAEPCKQADEHGVIHKASIAAYGDVVHTFVERVQYEGCFAPGFVPIRGVRDLLPEVGLLAIDHVVGNVERGELEPWVRYYEQTLGFSRRQHFDDRTITTGHTALSNTVMASGVDDRVRLLLNEPGRGTHRSQIEEYLLYHDGPGVQHVAFETRDIQATVRALRARGVEFVAIPSSYYDELRRSEIAEGLDHDELEALAILVDRDEQGQLLQIFTRMPQDRPTLFFEIIERRGSAGFGAGNIRALFSAIEREQAQRGNL
jgi:4-hydroxyphenylpyruvate dioxygenase